MVFEELAKGRASIFAPPARICCSSPSEGRLSLQLPFWSPLASLEKDGAEAARGEKIRPVLRTCRGDPNGGGSRGRGWGGGREGFRSPAALS